MGCCEASFLLFAIARETGTLLTTKCPAPGTHRVSNTRGLPGGVPAAGIDAHMSQIDLRLISTSPLSSPSLPQELFLNSM